MFAYPNTLPKKEIQEVISTIVSRNFASDSKEFAKAVWVLAGYALSQTVGELPQSFGAMSSSGLTSLSNEEAVQVLQSCCDQADAPEGTVQAFNVNWKQVLSWALQLLAQMTAG